MIEDRIGMELDKYKKLCLLKVMEMCESLFHEFFSFSFSFSTSKEKTCKGLDLDRAEIRTFDLWHNEVLASITVQA